MDWRNHLFDDAPASLRRLSLILYAMAAPALALATCLFAQDTHACLWAAPSIAGLSLTAVAWLALRKGPTTADWVFPMGIVPIACFAIAQLASGNTAMGPMVVAGSTVAIAASLYTPPTVLASMATAVVFFFVMALRREGWLLALDESATVLLFQAIAAWVGKGKLVYLRRMQSQGMATLALLKQSEANFRTFFETIDDMVIVTGLDGRITYVNPLLVSKLGFEASSLLGRHIWDLRPPQLRSEAEEHFRDTLRTRSHACELPLADRRGALVHAQSRSWLGKWNGEDCVFFASRDVTAEQEAERRFETVFRNNPAIVAITAVASEKLVEVNQTLVSKLGYGRDELIGRTATEIGLFPHPDHTAELNRIFKRDGHLEVPDATLRCKDGSLLSCSYTGEIITSQGEEYFLSVLLDTTARKEAEKALLALNGELKLATEHANHLARQAEAASRAKSDFLANMSHEIRTPMNGVMGMAELLLQSKLDDEQQIFAETIYASGERLLAIVNDLLDFSKMEAGKLALAVHDFDLYRLLDDLAETMGLKAAEKNVELVHDIALDVPERVRGDAGRLRQILVNLVGNALKFTEKGEVVLSVRRLSEAGEDTVLRFEVKDTGIGIPDEAQGALFGKFVQVDSSRTRKFGGTGLGLAISKQLTELMGGQIGLRSQFGVGSQFWFTVRVQACEAGPAPAPAFNGIHILVLDDNATARTALTNRLESWGARVAGAADLESARALLAQTESRFDLMFVDQHVPGMDSEAFARALTQDSSPTPKLVLMPVSGHRLEEERFKECGYCCFLPKPVRHFELLDGLTRLKEGATTWARRPTSTTLRAVEALPAGERRVLLAEDNSTNRQVALGMLARLGVATVAVGDGREAVHALRRQRFDLVLMDVQMPVLDGIEATRAIRRFEPGDLNAGIPILALTAHALASDREVCLEAGMNDALTKPISSAAMAAALKRWLPKPDHGEAGAEPLADENVRPSPTPGGSGLWPDPRVFDARALVNALGGDRALAQEVAADFPANADNLLDGLARHLDSGDAAAAVRHAHTLHGASASIRGVALATQASQCEAACRRADLPEASRGLHRLRHELAALKNAIEAFCGS